MPARTSHFILHPPTKSDIAHLFALMGDQAATLHTQTEPTLASCRETILYAESNRTRQSYAPWTFPTPEQKIIYSVS